jgi:sugar phosphate permease
MGLTVSSFSVYFPFIIDTGNLTKTQGAAILTTRSLFSLFSLLVVEAYHSCLGIRLGVTIASLIGAASFFFFGASNDFWGYCCAAALSGISYGLGGMVPASILINRWFNSHKALALSLCTSATGIAAAAVPLVMIWVITQMSLQIAFWIVAYFFIASSVAIFLFIRNDPQDKGIHPLQTGQENLPSAHQYAASPTRGMMVCMYVAVLLIGGVALGTAPNFSVLYTEEGFDSLSVSYLISAFGISLIVGKSVYGYFTDRLGVYKSGFFFFSIWITATFLSCLAGVADFAVALLSMFLYGVGMPIGTVGLSIFAKDISTSQCYERTVKDFQFLYVLGSILSGPLVGIIADTTDSYVPAYVFFSVAISVSMVLVQFALARRYAQVAMK